ncbi:hypothetical protein [Fluviispira multicolorata]|uniref:Uncharacterized protein n=1 Tax=Fluviispira multicolorata TaxID=2654512 RepID=A0A833JAL5_9BACT|nr:hypothetical protein [Fluviispira multicolorata]KAB8028129.1 hypothetical protein GCL57_13855 [Fluviispira multicolorata]
MYLLVFFLLLSLCQNNTTAQNNSFQNKTNIRFSEDIPFAILICEYCGLKSQRIKTTFDRNFVKNIKSLKLFSSSQWSADVKILFEKQQESEYQILGSKSWPPQIPFALSPLKEKNGLLILLKSDREIIGKQLPKSSSYILFYQGKINIESSDIELEKEIAEPELKLKKDDGVRFFIAKEVKGEQITALENVIKNFTDDKNSLIIPYEVTADGVNYRSDIEINNLMRTVKKINQVIPNLSAKKAHGMNDTIEIMKAK